MSQTLIHFQDDERNKQMLIDLEQISYGVYSPAVGDHPSALKVCMVGASLYHQFHGHQADLLWDLLKKRAGIIQ